MSLYRQFLDALGKELVYRDYGFSPGKRRSCDWIAARVPQGRGVDVGGTDYLVRKLLETGRDAVFYDLFPPAKEGLREVVTDDMANFAGHFEPASLDFITCRHTLEHSLNPLFQLWQFNRCLKDEGRLVVVVPIHDKGWTWFYTHFSCLPYENWMMLFHRSGFRVVESAAGTWKDDHPRFVEYRFVLAVEARRLRLQNTPDG